MYYKYSTPTWNHKLHSHSHNSISAARGHRQPLGWRMKGHFCLRHRLGRFTLTSPAGVVAGFWRKAPETKTQQMEWKTCQVCCCCDRNPSGIIYVLMILRSDQLRIAVSVASPGEGLLEAGDRHSEPSWLPSQFYFFSWFEEYLLQKLE